jgi:hypothetical protein
MAAALRERREPVPKIDPRGSCVGGRKAAICDQHFLPRPGSPIAPVEPFDGELISLLTRLRKNITDVCPHADSPSCTILGNAETSERTSESKVLRAEFGQSRVGDERSGNDLIHGFLPDLRRQAPE